MNFITGVLYLITAFLPVIITALNFDIASFTPIQLFAVFWTSCLSVINLRILVLPIGVKEKSRSSFEDKSGLVALAQTFNGQSVFFIYSILSGGLIGLKAFVLGDHFPVRILISIELVLLVLVFLVLWGFLATMQIEARQSNGPKTLTPRQLAEQLNSKIDSFKIMNSLGAQNETIIVLNSLYEKLRYQVNVTDSYIQSTNYSNVKNQVTDLIDLLDRASEIDIDKIQFKCKKIEAAI